MNTKTIEIPALLRIEVPESLTEQEVRQLEKDIASESLATVQDGVMESALKEHLRTFETDPDRVISADLWVN